MGGGVWRCVLDRLFGGFAFSFHMAGMRTGFWTVCVAVN